MKRKKKSKKNKAKKNVVVVKVDLPQNSLDAGVGLFPCNQNRLFKATRLFLGHARGEREKKNPPG